MVAVTAHVPVPLVIVSWSPRTEQAVKEILSLPIHEDPDAFERFKTELKLARRIRHVLGVSSEKLHADRSLERFELEINARPVVPPKIAFRRDQLGHEHIGPALLAKLAKNPVRDPGHGREVERDRPADERKAAEIPGNRVSPAPRGETREPER